MASKKILSPILTEKRNIVIVEGIPSDGLLAPLELVLVSTSGRCSLSLKYIFMFSSTYSDLDVVSSLI